MLPETKNLFLSCYIVRADMEISLSQYDAAIKDVNLYESHGGKDAYSLLWQKGQAYFYIHSHKQGKGQELDSAIRCFEKYVALAEQVDGKVYRFLGMAYAMKKDKFKSQLNFDKTVIANKKDPDNWFYYGTFQIMLGNNQKGKELIQKALEFKDFKKRAMAYYNLGWLNAVEKDSSKAYANFQKAIEIDSSMIAAYQARSYTSLWIFKASYETVMKDLDYQFRHATSEAKKASILYFMSWSALRYIKDFGKALKYIDEAIDLNGTDPSFYELRALVNYSKNELNVDLAMEDLNKAIGIDPNYGTAYLQKGILAALKGNYAESCKMLEKAIELGVKIPKKCKDNLCKGIESECTNLPVGPTYPKPTFLY
jgi:tetratricopeptide (TPR) repeat protein